MTDEHDTDARLAPYFEAAKQSDLTLPAGLTARIAADAARVQEGWREAEWRSRRAAPAPSLWRQFLAVIGGAPALGGLAAACAAGIWLGAAPPKALDPLALMSSDMTVYSASYLQDALLGEEGL